MQGSGGGRRAGMSSASIERLAIGFFIAVIVFSGLALVRPWFAWLAIAASVAGLGCHQAAAIKRARELRG